MQSELAESAPNLNAPIYSEGLLSVKSLSIERDLLAVYIFACWVNEA